MGQRWMIRTVAELLDAFLEKEIARLDALDISHPPTIGAVYEGLTRTVLDLCLPEQAELSVVSGFARGRDGVLSGELDALLVTGAGEDILTRARRSTRSIRCSRLWKSRRTCTHEKSHKDTTAYAARVG